jgi:hypothetical protein
MVLVLLVVREESDEEKEEKEAREDEDEEDRGIPLSSSPSCSDSDCINLHDSSA